MINNNMIKMYSAQGEFEGSLNSIGKKQDELIKKWDISMEWSTLNKEEGNKTKRQQVQILDYSPSSASYKFELVNLNRPHKYDRRKK